MVRQQILERVTKVGIDHHRIATHTLTVSEQQPRGLPTLNDHLADGTPQMDLYPQILGGAGQTTSKGAEATLRVPDTVVELQEGH